MKLNGITIKEKELAILLLRIPKTMEELRIEARMDYTSIRDVMKKMIKKGLLEKRPGFPTKYYLKKEYWSAAIQWEKELNKRDN
jgi:DNA-binding MarR family transcriptional regulator